MEKRHFFTESATVGKLLAQETDDEEDQEVWVLWKRGRGSLVAGVGDLRVDMRSWLCHMRRVGERLERGY